MPVKVRLPCPYSYHYFACWPFIKKMAIGSHYRAAALSIGVEICGIYVPCVSRCDAGPSIVILQVE